MVKGPMKIYTVNSKNSGRVIVSGSAAECAKALGVSTKYFYTIAKKSFDGLHKNYDITVKVINPTPIKSLPCITRGRFGHWEDVSRMVPLKDMDDEGFLIHYIVAVDGYLTTGVCCYDAAHHEWYESGNPEHTVPVTHWMPMPAKPTRKKEVAV